MADQVAREQRRDAAVEAIDAEVHALGVLRDFVHNDGDLIDRLDYASGWVSVWAYDGPGFVRAVELVESALNVKPHDTSTDRVYEARFPLDGFRGALVYVWRDEVDCTRCHGDAPLTLYPEGFYHPECRDDDLREDAAAAVAADRDAHWDDAA